MNMGPAIDQSCFVFAEEVCVGWDATFQFWETIVATLVAAIVMFFTILFSVRIANAQTKKTLDAAFEQESRDRTEREEGARIEAQQRERDARIPMASSLLRMAITYESAIATEDEHELAKIKAEWQALSVLFAASALPGAADLFEFADHVVDEAIDIHNAPTSKPADLVQQIIASRIGDRIQGSVNDWARTGELPATTLTALERVRAQRIEAEREAREKNDQFIAMLLAAKKGSLDEPSEPENLE